MLGTMGIEGRLAIELEACVLCARMRLLDTGSLLRERLLEQEEPLL